MGFFDRALFDFNGDGEIDFMEWSIGTQMIAGSRQEAIALTGDDTFYPGNDLIDEENEDLDLYELDDDETDLMDIDDIDFEDYGDY